MVLRGATALRGALEGVGPENIIDTFGPKKVRLAGTQQTMTEAWFGLEK